MSWLIMADCIDSCFVGMYIRIWCMQVCIGERIQCAQAYMMETETNNKKNERSKAQTKFKTLCVNHCRIHTCKGHCLNLY